MESADRDYAARLQREEDSAAMMEAKSGKACLLVAEIISVTGRTNKAYTLFKKHKIEPITCDDMVWFAERMMGLQEEFAANKDPTAVDVGYHYTKEGNLPRIRTHGLLTKGDRHSKNVRSSNQNGSVFGDGIYTSNNPTSFQCYGDVGLIVARLQGRTVRVTKLLSECDNIIVNTVIGDKLKYGIALDRYGWPVDDRFNEVILRNSKQCLPMIRYCTTLLSTKEGKECIINMQKSLEGIMNKFFNGAAAYDVGKPSPDIPSAAAKNPGGLPNMFPNNGMVSFGSNNNGNFFLKTSQPAAFQPPSSAGFGHTSTPHKLTTPEDFRKLLIAFYSKHNVHKLSEVEWILKRYKGKEESLFAKLAMKYNTWNPLDAAVTKIPEIEQLLKKYKGREQDMFSTPFGAFTKKGGGKPGDTSKNKPSPFGASSVNGHSKAWSRAPVPGLAGTPYQFGTAAFSPMQNAKSTPARNGGGAFNSHPYPPVAKASQSIFTFGAEDPFRSASFPKSASEPFQFGNTTSFPSSSLFGKQGVTPSRKTLINAPSPPMAKAAQSPAFSKIVNAKAECASAPKSELKSNPFGSTFGPPAANFGNEEKARPLISTPCQPMVQMVKAAQSTSIGLSKGGVSKTGFKSWNNAPSLLTSFGKQDEMKPDGKASSAMCPSTEKAASSPIIAFANNCGTGAQDKSLSSTSQYNQLCKQEVTKPSDKVLMSAPYPPMSKDAPKSFGATSKDMNSRLIAFGKREKAKPHGNRLTSAPYPPMAKAAPVSSFGSLTSMKAFCGQNKVKPCGKSSIGAPYPPMAKAAPPPLFGALTSEESNKAEHDRSSSASVAEATWLWPKPASKNSSGAKSLGASLWPPIAKPAPPSNGESVDVPYPTRVKTAPSPFGSFSDAPYPPLSKVAPLTFSSMPNKKENEANRKYRFSAALVPKPKSEEKDKFIDSTF